jgi:beta-lactamase class A
MARRELVGTGAARLRVAETIAAGWDELGIDGHLFARNLATGEELGFDADRPTPLASVVKVVIALAVLEQVADGRLGADQPLALDPEATAVGPTGAGAFRHTATIAVGDLVMLMLTVSDNASADRLLEHVGIDAVQEALRDWGRPEIRVRHTMQRLHDAAMVATGGDVDLALELAIASERGGAPAIEMLEPARANVGTARGLVALLADAWEDRIASPSATAELRRLMRMQVFTQRLSSDLRSDLTRVAGKTGTFLHLRHEVGVVESADGTRVAIAALTRCPRPAAVAADVDLAIGAAARLAFETLRDAVA